MLDVRTHPAQILTDLTTAYAAGDAPHGERLFTEALDRDLPWDVVCAAAARGVALARESADRPDA